MDCSRSMELFKIRITQVGKVNLGPRPFNGGAIEPTIQLSSFSFLFSKLCHPISFIAFDNFSTSSGHHQS